MWIWLWHVLNTNKRIVKIFERVKKKYGKIFDKYDEIKLSPRSLAYIVSEIQKYSLLNTNVDIKGKAYEEIVDPDCRPLMEYHYNPWKQYFPEHLCIYGILLFVFHSSTFPIRQTIEKRLINEHKYAPGQISVEYVLQIGSKKPRADLVIFDKNCINQVQEHIKLIIECKKETIDARNMKEGVEQLKSYMSACHIYQKFFHISSWLSQKF